MKITSQDNFTEHKITETIGMVTGNTVRARHVGHDFLAGLRNIIGGEVGSYTELLVEARDEATQRLIEEAEKKGADGIVCVRYNTSSVMGGMIEILAYGTAVKLSE